MNLTFDHALIADTLSAIHREVQSLRGLFRLQVGGKGFEMPVESYEWQPIAGVLGVEMCALPVGYWPEPALPNADYFLTRSHGPAAQADLQLPQAVVNDVLEGEVEFWKESSPLYVPMRAGDTFTLAPNERHGWRSQASFLCRVAFTPRITQL